MATIYQPLPPGPYIRVLEVRVSRFNSRVSYDLKTIALDDSSQKYLAVSYAWDDPTPVMRIDLAGGKTLPLSKTICELFDSLKKRLRVFTVWIDALCIDQQSPAEKALQVDQMGRVYSSATQVLVWLGPSTPTTQEAFCYMKSKRKLAWPDNWKKDEDYSGIQPVFSLLSHRWFRRLWVIQEATLSKNVLVTCGEDHIDFEIFSTFVYAIWTFFKDLAEYSDEDPSVLGLWCITRLIAIRWEFWETGTVRWERLLQQAFHCEATDKRDMVFAFRGLASKLVPVPHPDYTLDASIDKIYTETATALLCHGSSLDLLALCGITRNRSPTLPSWVPDFRFFSWDEPFVPCDQLNCNAGGPHPAKLATVSHHKLQLQVTIFDIAAHASPEFNSRSVTEQKATIQAIMAFRPKLPVEVSEHAWKHNLGYSMTMGMNIDDVPVGAKDMEYFEEWFEWLQSSSSDDDFAMIKDNEYHRTIGSRIDGWKAVVTQKGFLCIVPAETAIGDSICVVPGCRLPLILRGTPGIVEASEYVLAGWCFVKGIMHGEAVEMGLPSSNIALS